MEGDVMNSHGGGVDTAADVGPGAIEVPGPAPIRRRTRRTVWLVVGGALLLVAGLGSAGYAMWTYNEAAPVRAVERFLDALSDGDLETAMSLVDGAPGASSLLTQDVLDASRELAPVRDIEVTQQDGEIHASFRIGDTAVSRTFHTERDGEEWVITDALTPVPELSYFTSTNTTVNGATIPIGDAMVLPGAYSLAFESSHFVLDGETEFVIATSSDTQKIADTKVVLSEQGAATFTQLVSSSLSECLAMTGMTTPCGVDIAPEEVKGTFNEGSATRTLEAEDQAVLGAIPYILLGGDLMTARVSQGMTVDLVFKSEDSEYEWEYTWEGHQLFPQVDFAVEPLSVAWSY